MYCLMLQNAVLELLQKSKIKIASLLPVEHRSHDDISKLMESKVKSSLCLSLATKCYILGWVLLQFFCLYKAKPSCITCKYVSYMCSPSHHWSGCRRAMLYKSMYYMYAVTCWLVVMIQHLGFLYPLKRIQTDLMVKLKQDSSAASIYKWIKVQETVMHILLYNPA